jgi:hypothetical protein
MVASARKPRQPWLTENCGYRTFVIALNPGDLRINGLARVAHHNLRPKGPDELEAMSQRSKGMCDGV